MTPSLQIVEVKQQKPFEKSDGMKQDWKQSSISFLPSFMMSFDPCFFQKKEARITEKAIRIRASNYGSAVAVLSYRALNLLQQIRLAKRGIVLASIAVAYARRSLGLSALKPTLQK